eukprot:GHVU01012705.1.p1 GENE.GHVU01012705.1~~GHVU01012705.1.p1  ORF type:complete len:141 (+),score=10.41 GHVU01012705.1:613-1035(+)
MRYVSGSIVIESDRSECRETASIGGTARRSNGVSHGRKRIGDSRKTNVMRRLQQEQRKSNVRGYADLRPRVSDADTHTDAPWRHCTQRGQVSTRTPPLRNTDTHNYTTQARTDTHAIDRASTLTAAAAVPVGGDRRRGYR